VALLCHLPPSNCEMIVLLQTSRLQSETRVWPEQLALLLDWAAREIGIHLHVPDSKTCLLSKHCHYSLNKAQGKSRPYSWFLIQDLYLLLVFWRGPTGFGRSLKKPKETVKPLSLVASNAFHLKSPHTLKLWRWLTLRWEMDHWMMGKRA
jgi:hypothetical protein